MRQYRSFKTYHLERLKNSAEAQAYLDLALADYGHNHDADEFLLAIRDVATAQGGLGKLAQAARLNRQNLYKALSKEGNPQLETIGDILNALGFRLSVKPLMKSAVAKEKAEALVAVDNFTKAKGVGKLKVLQGSLVDLMD